MLGPALLLLAVLAQRGGAFGVRRASAVRSSLRMGADEALRTALAEAEERILAQNARIKELESYVFTGRMSGVQGSLKDLCQISKEACDIMTPMIRYAHIVQHARTSLKEL